jgi:hypothetical protein
MHIHKYATDHYYIDLSVGASLLRNAYTVIIWHLLIRFCVVASWWFKYEPDIQVQTDCVCIEFIDIAVSVQYSSHPLSGRACQLYDIFLSLVLSNSVGSHSSTHASYSSICYWYCVFLSTDVGTEISSDYRNGITGSQNKSIPLSRYSKLLCENRKNTLLIPIGYIFFSVQYITVCQNATVENSALPIVCSIQRKTSIHKSWYLHWWDQPDNIHVAGWAEWRSFDIHSLQS